MFIFDWSRLQLFKNVMTTWKHFSKPLPENCFVIAVLVINDCDFAGLHYLLTVLAQEYFYNNKCNCNNKCNLFKLFKMYLQWLADNYSSHTFSKDQLGDLED